MNKPVQNHDVEKTQSEPIGARPEFYLVYLAFYFFPWLFQRPTSIDMIVALAAILVFIPVYFHGNKQKGLRRCPHIIAISAIGFAVSPFFGSHGVFHIYAAVMAAFIRPERYAWITIVSLTLIFVAFSLLTHQSWWDTLFPIFIGLITSIGSISVASKEEQQRLLERSRELDQRKAALAERERIARDLHDLLGQTLTMVSLKSDVALKLFDQRPDQAKQEIQEISTAARTALRDVRKAVTGMNTTSLRAELSSAERVLSAAGINLDIKGDLPNLSVKTDQVLGLVVREAMTNIVRHSRASNAIFTANQVDNSLLLKIEDNGSSAIVNTEGAGLKGLRNRIDELGGSTHIDTKPNMKISLNIPNLRENP